MNSTNRDPEKEKESILALSFLDVRTYVQFHSIVAVSVDKRVTIETLRA